MTWPSRHLFDVIVDVSTLGVRKPQPEPFLHVLHQLDSSPDACVFVDDMEVNCRAAEAVGMQSQWFNIVQPQASTTHLRERIGL